MTALRKTIVATLAIGSAALSFSTTAAFADHKGDGPGKGYGYGHGAQNRALEVYVDAGGNRELQRAITYALERQNRYIDVVFSPRYADVTIRVNGRLSNLYRTNGGYGRYNDGQLTLNYNYKVKVKAGRRTVFNDRVRGSVVQPERGYYPGAYSPKGEIAKQVFGVLVDILAKEDSANNFALNDIRWRGDDGRYPNDGRSRYDKRYRYNLEQQMRLQAYSEIADYIARYALPGGGWRR